MQRFRNIDITGPRTGYIALGRQVPYKRADLAIQACNRLGLPLAVYGNGSEHQRFVDMAGPTITFYDHATDAEVTQGLIAAKGYLFPQEEDFGIVQVEAMAAGTPVIAYGVGGSRDAVIEGKTGVFFEKQSTSSLVKALRRFEKMKFDPTAIQKHAEALSEENFIKKLRLFVKEKTS
jgi:glycosyltransferase involved in cell wall biosynthesis